jgi:hypothetical protein
MEKPAEQVYTELLRQLDSTMGSKPEVLADRFQRCAAIHDSIFASRTDIGTFPVSSTWR